MPEDFSYKGKQLAERLRGFTYKVRGFSHDPEGTKYNNYMNNAAMLDILKEIYNTDMLEDLIFKDNPMLKMIKKD